MYTETFAYAQRTVHGRDGSNDDRRDTTNYGALTKYSSDSIPRGTCRLDRQPEDNAGRGGERGKEVLKVFQSHRP